MSCLLLISVEGRTQGFFVHTGTTTGAGGDEGLCALFSDPAYRGTHLWGGAQGVSLNQVWWEAFGTAPQRRVLCLLSGCSKGFSNRKRNKIAFRFLGSMEHRGNLPCGYRDDRGDRRG